MQIADFLQTEEEKKRYAELSAALQSGELPDGAPEEQELYAMRKRARENFAKSTGGEWEKIVEYYQQALNRITKADIEAYIAERQRKGELPQKLTQKQKRNEAYTYIMQSEETETITFCIFYFWAEDHNEAMRTGEEKTRFRVTAQFFDLILFKIKELYPQQAEENIRPAKVEKIEKALDKVNANIWNLTEEKQKEDVLFFNTAPKKGEKALIRYVINFSELEATGQLRISRQLSPYDKRVQECIAALYNAGNKVFSVTQIYNVMTGKKKPSQEDIKKINDSVTKMQFAQIKLTNNPEGEENGEASKLKGYPVFEYSGYLLPCKRITKSINGQICEAAIYMFEEPPLISFAKGRKQITAILPCVLASPINKTPTNILIEDYLLERIAHAKAGKLSEKILFESIYKQCGATEKKQRSRARDTAKRFLDYWASAEGGNFIEDYTEAKDGITIQTGK